MNSKVSRNVFLDFLRIIACFFVIVNHTGMDQFLTSSPEEPVWFVSLFWFFLSKTAVPVFLMISGYLLLGRADSWRKNFSRVKRILIVLISCAVIYGVYHVLKNSSGKSLMTLLMMLAEDITKVYMRVPSNAFWYLYLYLGLLVILPFLQKMSIAMQKQDFHILFLVSGIFLFVMPVLNHYSPYLTICTFFETPLFSGYIIILFIGQYFSRFDIAKTKKRFLVAALILIASVTFSVMASFLEYLRNPDDYLFFDNVLLFPVVLSSACVFYMASFLTLPQKAGQFISRLGSHTFGIYLISDMLIDITSPVYQAAYASAFPFAAIILYEAGIFLCGWILAALLRKIPAVGKLV